MDCSHCAPAQVGPACQSFGQVHVAVVTLSSNVHVPPFVHVSDVPLQIVLAPPAAAVFADQPMKKRADYTL